jgi:hypothetical protein
MNPEISTHKTFNEMASPLADLTTIQRLETPPETIDQIPVNRALMHSLANGLSTEDQRLILAASEVALYCHAAHSRQGDPPLHYSHHLFEVAKRVKENFCESKNTSSALDKSQISELAVAVVVALLHDTMEDISNTFPSLNDRELGFLTVERYIRKQFSELADEKTIDRICECVRILSIKNESDFIDSKYIAEINADWLCRQVKWADVDHNMESMPDVFPLSGSIHFPAQLAELMRDSSYNERFLHQVCIAAKRTSGKVSVNDLRSNALGNSYMKLYNFEGEAGLDRLETFYQSLSDLHTQAPESLAFPAKYSKDQMSSVLKEQLNRISQVRQVLNLESTSG